MIQKASMKRFAYAFLAMAVAAIVITVLASLLLNVFNANNVNDVPKIHVDNRAEPLRRAIFTQLSILGESTVQYSGSLCSRTVEVTSEDSDTSHDDTPFTCLITAESGNTYEAEISLLKMGDSWYELPAIFTPINEGVTP